MHYVVVPEPVILETFDGKPLALNFANGGGHPAGTPWTLQLWMHTFVWGDERWGASYKAAKSAKRVRRAFKGKEVGEVVALEEADYVLLKAIVETPAQAQSGSLSSQFCPLMEAIMEAKDEPPLKAVAS